MRDFVFVKDVVSVNLAAAEVEVSGVFNIGQGKVVSLREVMRIIEDISRRPLSASLVWGMSVCHWPLPLSKKGIGLLVLM